MGRFSRTKLIFGEKGMAKLADASILVVGIGGVGGYVCEMLARSGIGKLTLVDFDVVTQSNINRQIIALTSTIGKPKVEVMANRINEINPDCEVVVYNDKFCLETADKIFCENFDYVVDAIDDINAKITLIKTCKQKQIRIISAMGAGNRKGIPNFVKTFNDPFAKKFRKIAKDNLIDDLDVAFSSEIPVKTEGVVGSTSYFPSACGIVISSFVINKIIEL